MVSYTHRPDPPQKLLIVGDRQAGKSHTMELLAIGDAIQGRFVVWQTFNRDYARNMLERLHDTITYLFRQDLIQRTSRKGLSILFTSGGVIAFWTPRSSIDQFQLRPVDTHILDDNIDCAESWLGATRIYKAVLS